MPVEMPPLCAYGSKASTLQRLTQAQCILYQLGWNARSILPCCRTEIIKVSQHQQLATALIHQGDIDRRTTGYGGPHSQRGWIHTADPGSRPTCVAAPLAAGRHPKPLVLNPVQQDRVVPVAVPWPLQHSCGFRLG